MSSSIAKLIEGSINEQFPNTYLQKHEALEVFIDLAAANDLTRIKTPWLTGPCIWDDYMTRKAVFWLCKLIKKPILKLTDMDYNDNGMSDLVTEHGPASKINIKCLTIFNIQYQLARR